MPHWCWRHQISWIWLYLEIRIVSQKTIINGIWLNNWICSIMRFCSNSCPLWKLWDGLWSLLDWLFTIKKILVRRLRLCFHCWTCICCFYSWTSNLDCHIVCLRLCSHLTFSLLLYILSSNIISKGDHEVISAWNIHDGLWPQVPCNMLSWLKFLIEWTNCW